MCGRPVKSVVVLEASAVVVVLVPPVMEEEGGEGGVVVRVETAKMPEWDGAWLCTILEGRLGRKGNGDRGPQLCHPPSPPPPARPSTSTSSSIS